MPEAEIIDFITMIENSIAALGVVLFYMATAATYNLSGFAKEKWNNDEPYEPRTAAPVLVTGAVAGLAVAVLGEPLNPGTVEPAAVIVAPALDQLWSGFVAASAARNETIADDSEATHTEQAHAALDGASETINRRELAAALWDLREAPENGLDPDADIDDRPSEPDSNDESETEVVRDGP